MASNEQQPLTPSAPRDPLRECILVAEDNESDLILLKRALKVARVLCRIHAVSDGDEAIAYLKGEGKYANRIEYPLPTLVVLDLKMPNMDGFEVLRWIRGQPTLCRLPVLVLTISNNLTDINRAYALGANSFLNKSFEYQSTKHLAESIKNFWLTLSRPPVDLESRPDDLSPQSPSLGPEEPPSPSPNV